MRCQLEYPGAILRVAHLEQRAGAQQARRKGPAARSEIDIVDALAPQVVVQLGRLAAQVQRPAGDLVDPVDLCPAGG